MESPLADDDDNDDLSDDTATLLSMLPGASVVVDEHDEVVRCNPAAYRLGVVSDDAIAQQHVLDAIHEARKSGGKRQFDLTTDTPERYVADQNKGDHVATQSVHRPNWLKVTVGRINEQFVIVLITDVSDVIRFAQVRDSFITNVSEQLLGPTEALAKLADSLESGNLDEQQVAADARQVRSSCSKLNHMVSDLLLLIRAQEPITPSSANRLNVMEQLRATAARLEPQAAEAGVQLNIKGLRHQLAESTASQAAAAVTYQYPHAGAKVAYGTTVYLYTDTYEGSHTEVPDVTGKSADFARQMLSAAGLNCVVEGNANGTVQAQSADPGSSVQRGTVVTITCG